MQINRKVEEGLYKKSFKIKEQTSLREKRIKLGQLLLYISRAGYGVRPLAQSKGNERAGDFVTKPVKIPVVRRID